METIVVTRTDGVVEVTLNRPDIRNAINHTMQQELSAVFREIVERPDDRVLVISGRGAAFCAGADLGESAARSDEHTLVRMQRATDLMIALHRMPKPTLAKVDGWAVGAGCNLALVCDLVVASPNAQFSEIFVRRGLSLDYGGSWLLPRLVGLRKAKELTFFGDVVSAEDAERLGLVNCVVPAGDLDQTVDEWARRLADGPPLALRMDKMLLNAGAVSTLEDAVEFEGTCAAVNSGAADTQEAFAAFREKREPRFSGR